MEQSPDLNELFSKFVPTAFSVIGKAALAAVLYGLEYLVDKNSPCPCDPKWNATHSDLAFCVPTVVLLLISMMVVPGCRRLCKCGTCSRCPECKRCSGRCKCRMGSGSPRCEERNQCPECGSRCQCNSASCGCWNTCRKICYGLNILMQVSIPSIIWVVILLLDGDYFACYYAPSVNQTHGHQKCKEFCSLETLSSLREHCFTSRKIGSILLVSSVVFLVLLKFTPRWTSCDFTEEGYYEFKYQRAVEKKKLSKMKEQLGKRAAETANTEARKLISELKLSRSDQGEQDSNQGEQNSNQGEQNSNQVDQNSNQVEQNSNQGEQNSNQGEQSSNQVEQNSNQGEQSSN
ncbi:uncharacterized protein LOC134346140 [Mobula hypostoma]|uniref:uncharacterized protein LOC134346140 n=1 Tax=Mobula hypostoma TaxID=723540 RepID=UPI002FC384F8